MQGVLLDEGFFSTEIPDSEKDKPLKRGHGSQKKTKVLVLAETAEGTPTKKSDKPTRVKHIKMIVISNAKRLLLDVYHDITPGYLQNYLNEYCYKFNRRYFGDGLFDRLMVAALAYKNNFRYNIA